MTNTDISKSLVSEDFDHSGPNKIKENLEDYSGFLKSIIDIISLSNSRQAPKSVNIFTTNYDLFIEKAVDEIITTSRLIFNDGANGYFKRILDSSNYNQVISYKGLNDNYISEIPSISLIKPHGSMNWYKEGENIVVGYKVTETPLIVKPTGFEERDTFLNNHYYEMLRIFQLELDKPQSVLFIIGFSFQDKHIAKMIKRALQNPELLIIVFGYSDNDKQSFIDNLNINVSPQNLRIYTPGDFNKKNLSRYEDKYGTAIYRFELFNLTSIINNDFEEGL